MAFDIYRVRDVRAGAANREPDCAARSLCAQGTLSMQRPLHEQHGPGNHPPALPWLRHHDARQPERLLRLGAGRPARALHLGDDDSGGGSADGRGQCGAFTAYTSSKSLPYFFAGESLVTTSA
ncbi:MAG: hypothetical protein M3410_10795 [Acidobacteriota bacterium]|nr:hypothetical protein [Acidobacteriota bacterium]